jgi:hypothetical protein
MLADGDYSSLCARTIDGPGKDAPYLNEALETTASLAPPAAPLLKLVLHRARPTHRMDKGRKRSQGGCALLAADVAFVSPGLIRVDDAFEGILGSALIAPRYVGVLRFHG